MKNSTSFQRFKRIGLLSMSLTFFAAMFFYSCQKDLDTTPYTSGTPSSTGNARIMFVHASPNLQGFNLYFNGSKINGDSIRFNDIIGYQQFSIGTADQSFSGNCKAIFDSTVTIFKADSIFNSSNHDISHFVRIDTTFTSSFYYTPNYNGVVVWTDTTVNTLPPLPTNDPIGKVVNLTKVNLENKYPIFKPNGSYTCFILDSARKILSNYNILYDDLSAPPSNKAKVRFYALSPDTNEVDVTFTGAGPSDTLTFTNVAFRKWTNFYPINAGIYTIDVKLTGTSTLLFSMQNIDLQDGKIYTVYDKGFPGGSSNPPLTGSVIKHN